MSHEMLFSLLDKIQNIKKMNTRELIERKFEKEVKSNRMSYFNIYLVVFAFLTSTVEEERW